MSAYVSMRCLKNFMCAENWKVNYVYIITIASDAALYLTHTIFIIF
jgi:hypothetical protein